MLKCDCGNETEFIEETQTSFTIDAEKNRKRKVEEKSRFFCNKCNTEIIDD